MAVWLQDWRQSVSLELDANGIAAARRMALRSNEQVLIDPTRRRPWVGRVRRCAHDRHVLKQVGTSVDGWEVDRPGAAAVITEHDILRARHAEQYVRTEDVLESGRFVVGSYSTIVNGFSSGPPPMPGRLACRLPRASAEWKALARSRIK